MEKRQDNKGRDRQPRWDWLLLGVSAYIAMGAIMKQAPNPMLPEAILALNMVVPVIVGYFAGPLTGGLVGLLGTGLNFSFHSSFTGPAYYEGAAIVPHAIMGATAGWVSGRTGSRIITALTIVVGHTLNIFAFLVFGLITVDILQNITFWTGLFAETTVDVILIAIVITAMQQREKREFATAVTRLGWHRFLLNSGIIALIVVVLALSFSSGIKLAGYLFVLPVILAAFMLGSIEALFTSLLLSGVLGLNIRAGETTSFSAEAIALILMLNVVALALGELANNVQKQRELAQRRLLELETAYAALSEADFLKSEMIQNISHELRTPLAIILGYTELLAQGALGEMTQQQCETIQTTWEHGRRLAYLVEQITVLHQAEQGNLSWQALALDSLVRTHIDRMRTAAAANNCTFTFVTVDETPILEGDLQCLGRVVNALLDNAIKFSPDGGEILVKIWAEPERVAVSVHDSGLGIPLDKQQEIFRRFYQVDGSVTRRFGGMGTGLALTKEVVQAHGGEVWVQSRPGEGSTFGFWLPIERPVHISPPAIPLQLAINLK
jgi:signal transduction histidine kinase